MINSHQLYMWSGARARILDRHDFYVTQVKRRVLGHFADIEAEAKRFADSEYDRLGSMPFGEDGDMSTVAEAALDRAQSFYGLLDDLRRQMLLGALAGCFKELRDFIARELRHTIKAEDAQQFAWNLNIGKVFDLIEEFGWNCRRESFFARIDAIRLVVNVYKHGKGSSFIELASNHPEFLQSPLTAAPRVTDDFLRYNHLEITDRQFDELTAALRAFWITFPERLFVHVK